MKVVIQETFYNTDKDTNQMESTVSITTEGDGVLDTPSSVAKAHQDAVRELLKEEE